MKNTHNHNYRQLSLLITILFLFFNSKTKAGIDPSYNKWVGSSLNPVTNYSHEADKWPVIQSSTYQNISCENKLTFGIDIEQDLTSISQKTYWEIDLTLNVWNTTSTYNTVSKTFQISYDPSAGKTHTVRSYYSFNDGYNVDIQIDEVREGTTPGSLTPLTTVPDYLYLEAQTFVDRVYTFDRTVSPVIASATDPTGKGLINLTWASIAGAESYDLEWTYVDSYSGTFGAAIPTNSLFYDFGKDANRVTVQGTGYDLNDVYDQGVVVFRIRAVGRDITDPGQRQEGVWNIPPSGKITFISGTDSYEEIGVNDAHVPNLHWQYSAGFSSEGKHKASVSYYDDGMKNRQVVTRISTEGLALVGESIYDAQGRAAIQVLPAPTKDKDFATDLLPKYGRRKPRSTISLDGL